MSGISAVLGSVALAASHEAAMSDVPTIDWPVYRGDPKGNQHVEVAQINAANVHQLKPAWEYHTGDASGGGRGPGGGGRGGSMYTNPLVIDGLMYITTASLNAVALDAKNGRQVWRFDSSKYNAGNAVIRLRNRGVTYWKGAEGSRIFHFVKDRAYALNARTGELITSFGQGGFIDLRENLGIDPARAVIEMTTPGAVYKNFLIVASRVNEDYDASPGHIRAYDTVTGELKWIFHTIPQPGEFGHDTWNWVKGENYGGANAWGGVTVDEQRGWVFVATGSPTDDFYGAFRKGANLFGNCVLALDATTGKRIWHYQTVHHDLWDYDNPSAPILVTLRSGGTTKDAVVQLTKMGLTFVLDRETGAPLFPVTEVPVPRSNVAGEETSPTQPIPSKPPPLARQTLTEADLTNISPEARAYALQEFRRFKSGSIYTPPSVQGTITTPGFFGGVEWHGASFDPASNVLYVNANDASTLHTLRAVHDLPSEKLTPIQLGHQIYAKTCIACHGSERQGLPPLIPPLQIVNKTKEEIGGVIRTGRNIMPSFSQLRPREVDALVAYLTALPGEVKAAAAAEGAASAGSVERYSVDGYRVFTDQHGYPAVAPPWGTLNAINLATGDLLWKVPLGEYPELVAKGIRHTGTLNFGGVVGTSGGIVFVAATADEKIRAFEKQSGKVLWEYQLPAGGYATPSIYVLGGRQYVVIAAGGGGKNATKAGDSIVAFALPTEAGAAGGTTMSAPRPQPDAGWIDLFDGSTLTGWVHMNGWHTYTVEDGAIVGRTMEGSPNSFLCTLQEFGDFELEVDTTVDKVTNQGIQFRSQIRPFTTGEAGEGRGAEQFRAGRVYGPQVEIRRFYAGQPTTGTLYGEALGTGWLSSPEKVEKGHHHFNDEGWNKVRIVAKGPRLQTWVNGQPIDDIVNEAVYKTHPKGFIGLQIHGLTGREPGFQENGLQTNVPSVMKWRNIRIRPLPSN